MISSGCSRPSGKGRQALEGTVTPAERERRRAELMAELVELAEQELPGPARTLDELEDLADRVGKEATRQVLEKLAQRRQEADLPTEHTCAHCQQRARYKGRYGLEIITALGRIRLRRPYFYCAHCRTGCVPVDTAWRLGPANTTPKAQARVAYLAHALPYQRLPASLQQLGLPIRLDVSTCEKITQALGAALEQRPPPGPEAGAGVLVVQVDGVMVPTRDGYREAQCGVLYEPDPAADRSPGGCAGLRKEFWGAVQDRAAVIAEACRRLEARRGSALQRVGVMGDGARWIWDDFAPRVPNRREILDFYHATQHLATVAAARFSDPAAREQWLQDMRHELRHIGPWRVIREVERWRPTTAAARQIRREELGYLRRNRERMHYPDYVREGFAIGTGAVEGACKNLVGARLKGTGMRWNAATARPVVHLRAAVLTDPQIDLRAYAGRATRH
jgi:hypothetical protein